jgi:hypothetical protein
MQMIGLSDDPIKGSLTRNQGLDVNYSKYAQ